MTPQPTELTAELRYDEVEQHRNLDCKNYDSCVVVASEARSATKPEHGSPFWASWSCARCPLWALRGEAKQNASSFAERREQRSPSLVLRQSGAAGRISS